MAVGERQRRELFDRLSDLLGDDMADVLFEHLPPAGPDVATREQLDAVEQRLSGRIAALDERLTGQIADLDGRVADLDGRVADLDGRVADLDGRIADLDRRVAGLDLDRRFEAFEERLTGTLMAAWRRDLLVHSMGQFFALVAAVAALVALA